LPHEKAGLTVEVQLCAGVASYGVLDDLNRAIVNADGGKACPPLELLFDPRGKGENGIYPGAFQISSGKRQNAHQFIRRGNPAVLTVESTDAVSVLRMDDSV